MRLHESGEFPVSDPGPPERFDFGLSGAQEERALLLHSSSIVFDMLSQHAGGRIYEYFPAALMADFAVSLASRATRAAKLAEAVYWPFDAALDRRSSLLVDWLRQSGLTCGTYDIDVLVDGQPDPIDWDWDERLGRICSGADFRVALTAQDIRKAKRDGTIALYANYQPTTPLSRNLDSLDRAYVRGLRSLMLTYNRMDHVGVGCTERVDAGLSMFGKDALERCNALGIIADTSHCGFETTMDACRLSASPVTANHTAASAVYPHARNKSDNELRAIADTGGVIGIVTVPAFLSGGPAASINDMLDHIDHVCAVVGPRHVALGTDWPMQAPDDVLVSTFGAELASAGFRPQDRVDLTDRLVGFADCRDLINITRGLVGRNYCDDDIKGILGENALRVFEAVCG